MDLERYTAKSSETVRFRARAQGEPAPAIVWFKNDRPLEMSDRLTESAENGLHILTISNIVGADQGCYDCAAKNVHGESWTRGISVVNYRIISSIKKINNF